MNCSVTFTLDLKKLWDNSDPTNNPKFSRNLLRRIKIWFIWTSKFHWTNINDWKFSTDWQLLILRPLNTADLLGVYEWEKNQYDLPVCWWNVYFNKSNMIQLKKWISANNNDYKWNYIGIKPVFNATNQP